MLVFIKHFLSDSNIYSRMGATALDHHRLQNHRELRLLKNKTKQPANYATTRTKLCRAERPSTVEGHISASWMCWVDVELLIPSPLGVAAWEMDCHEQSFIPGVITNIIFYVCCDREKVGIHAVENVNKAIITALRC